MEQALLEVRKVSKSFGGLVAVSSVSFEAQTGKILAIIGPNGAGKTTLFNMICGVFPPDEGEIYLNGCRIDRLPLHQVASWGVARTFQNIRIFANMSVLENVMMGRYRHERAGLFQCAMGLSRREDHLTRSTALKHLKRVGLADKAEYSAASLPLGEQRLLELARALAVEPCLLLLDEPTAGLNAVETVRLAAMIGRIQANDIAVLLVEHDMNLVMSIADWVLVLNYGLELAQGRPEMVQNNPQVVAAYLGEGDRNSDPLGGSLQ
jgi:ABC-type branched-subunit amino acid transport system ATPase component